MPFWYLILGILPSLIWLFYFLKKDIHPEPKTKITLVFLGGALITLPVLFLEIIFWKLLGSLNFNPFWETTIGMFLVVALTEEVGKYLSPAILAFRSKVFDEPLDAVVYMVSSAMGFAAVENTALFFGANFPLAQSFGLALVRFLGATLLHALSSALLGTYIAKAYFQKKGKKEILVGVALAFLWHGFYNWGIILAEESLKFWLIILTLTALAVLIQRQIKSLKYAK